MPLNQTPAAPNLVHRVLAYLKERWPGAKARTIALFGHKATRIVVLVAAVFALLGVLTFAFYYHKYERIVDERITRPIFNRPAQIFARPEEINVGDTWSLPSIANELRNSGYASGAQTNASSVGTFALGRSYIEVTPGPASFHPSVSARITIANGVVASITGSKGEAITSYPLEPQLITGLADAKARSKRRLLTYREIPPLVVNSIVSTEDRRFFEHSGVNYGRLLEGILTPLLRHRRMQGGSTLTMQMARSFFLTNERRVGRKLAEIMIALILERRFTKEQILELYVNQVDLGQQGTFNIRGFGEGAQDYFGKDIGGLTLPEAALLTGIVNGPTVFSPVRHPKNAVTRRNVVLRAMLDNHAITAAQFEAAKETPLKLAPPNLEAEDAPFFVDMVRDRLLTQYNESDLDNGNLRIYTPLDRSLQRVASEAISVGMRQVDAAIVRQRTHKVRKGTGKNAVVETHTESGPMPQVALIALDPHTGEILALSGGRDYAASQLNHVIASRPTGSIFKPFVYATAIATGLAGKPDQAYTQLTQLDASEGTFDDNGKPYTPHNFDPAESTGEVTARYALMHSINTATIRLAQLVGLDKVVQLARAAGIDSVKATPAMAIGAYDSNALVMAGAYTIFANGGVLLPPVFIRSVRHQDAGEMPVPPVAGKATVLDPRVASVMTDMLTAVLDGGTASAVRARFSGPAAGKTGSSHDAWFAGYTSNLLCLVWVGNDDYTDIKIEGGKAAAPIWAEFMARASKLKRYKKMTSFAPAPGVVTVPIDKVSNLPADESCPDDYVAAFIDGTVPAMTCGHPEGQSQGNFFQRMFGIGGHRELVLPPVNPNAPPPATGNPSQPDATGVQPAPQPVPAPQKKRGFWKRLFGGNNKNENDTAPAPTAPNPPPVQPPPQPNQ
jgi:penicillin-binding protein 1B